MLLSEHVYYVAIAFKMTEWVEHWICIKVCVKFEHSSAKTIWWFRSHSYGQLVIGSFIMTMCLLMHHISCRVFWRNVKSSRWLLAFPKTKITFERVSISGYWWDSGKYNRAADGNWVNCVRSQVAYFVGDWGVIVLCTVVLVCYIFSNKCLYFSCYMNGYFLDSPVVYSAQVLS